MGTVPCHVSSSSRQTLPVFAFLSFFPLSACRYVALNVLVFDEELPAVEERVRQMAQARVDAVIVQVNGKHQEHFACILAASGRKSPHYGKCTCTVITVAPACTQLRPTNTMDETM